MKCNNNSGDATLIQNSLNSIGSGATLSLSGTCLLGGSTLYPAGPVTITGSATLNYSGSGYVIQYAADNLTVTGLTFNGGGIHATSNFQQGGWTITNNTFQNITSGANGIQIDNELVGATLGKGHNAIDNNHFTNIWQGGYPNIPGGISPSSCGGDCISGTGFWLAGGGLDDTSISRNTFDKIGFNGIKGFITEQLSATPGWAFIGHNISMNDNTFTNVHRIGIELQVQGGTGGCKGGCDYATNNVQNDGWVISGNYWHAPALQYNVMAFSILAAGTNAQYLNNTAVDEVSSVCYVGPAIGIEDGAFNYSVTQGNVIGAYSGVCQGFGPVGGWAGYVVDSYSKGSKLYMNNVLCGGGQPAQGIDYNGSYNSSVVTETADYKVSACPNDSSLTTSSIVPVFTSSANQFFPAGGKGTWNVAVVSNLSIRNVQFFIDGSTTPAAMQQLQDVNSNFGTDKTWQYHATIDTSAMAGGNHTITASATDVSGAIKTVSQGFVVGYSGAPTAQVGPSALSFGSSPVGSITAAQVVTLQNTGSAPLVVSGINMTGSNAADFGYASVCGTSVAVGASCAINVTFTPSAGGSRTASLTVVSNAAGSPNLVSLTGTGTVVSIPVNPPPPSTLPTNLPTGMILWLANDAGVVANGTTASKWTDESGAGNHAVQTIAANQPLVVAGNYGQKALRFDGQSSFMSISNLPINGYRGLSIFLVSASAADPGAGWGSYALLGWGETASWGATFFGDYQTTSHFRFGTTQVGNENGYQMPLNRTDSFGLGEWIHAGTTDSVWLNGQSLASYTGKVATLAGAGNSAFLGGGLNGSFYMGDVSEVVVYSRALSTSERQAVEQYLMTKYHL